VRWSLSERGRTGSRLLRICARRVSGSGCSVISWPPGATTCRWACTSSRRPMPRASRRRSAGLRSSTTARRSGRVPSPTKTRSPSTSSSRTGSGSPSATFPMSSTRPWHRSTVRARTSSSSSRRGRSCAPTRSSSRAASSRTRTRRPSCSRWRRAVLHRTHRCRTPRSTRISPCSPAAASRSSAAASPRWRALRCWPRPARTCTCSCAGHRCSGAAFPTAVPRRGRGSCSNRRRHSAAGGRRAR
jgi:hypothetical protein